MSTLEEAVMSGELMTVPVAQQIFRAETPAEILAEARMVAEALKPALLSGGMVQEIGDNEHVKIEGWQTLGSMLKVFPHIVWTRRLEAFDGWEAHAEIRTLEGNIIGTADGMCERGERNWRDSPEYAIRSMAQTRAMSKAFAGPLRFIVTLAGYSGVPAEEMGGGATLAYGKPARSKDLQNLEQAALILYEGEIDPVGKLIERLAGDAGGYVPRISARAVQLVAAYRPGRPEPEPDPVAEQDAADAEAEVVDGHVEPEVADPTAIEPEAAPPPE